MKKPFLREVPTSELLRDMQRSAQDLQFLCDQRDSSPSGSPAREHYAIQEKKERDLYEAFHEELVRRRVIQ